jgi:hypothetical protein
MDRNRKKAEQDLFGSALICSTLANINRDPKKHRKPFSPLDFMPSKREKKTQTAEEQLQVLVAINAALGGSDERGECFVR